MVQIVGESFAQDVARLFGSLTLASSHLEASIDMIVMHCNDLEVPWLGDLQPRFPLQLQVKGAFICNATKLDPLNQIESAAYFSHPDFSLNFGSFCETRNWITHGRLISFNNSASGLEFKMCRFFPPQPTKGPKSKKSVPWKLRIISEEQILISASFAHEARLQCDALEKGLWRFFKAWPSILNADPQVIIDPTLIGKNCERAGFDPKQESKQS